MLQILETRLDNLVYQLGFAPSRPAARQMVAHGHLMVNGQRVNVPSYAVQLNDTIEVRSAGSSKQLATKNLEGSTSRAVPEWLNLDRELFKGVLTRIPTRDEIQPIANEQVVVEFYSR
jgi:small subunit ribosomal protein S4